MNWRAICRLLQAKRRQTGNALTVRQLQTGGQAAGKQPARAAKEYAAHRPGTAETPRARRQENAAEQAPAGGAWSVPFWFTRRPCKLFGQKESEKALLSRKKDIHLQRPNGGGGLRSRHTSWNEYKALPTHYLPSLNFAHSKSRER